MVACVKIDASSRGTKSESGTNHSDPEECWLNMIHREVSNKSIFKASGNPARTGRMINPELLTAGEISTRSILIYHEAGLHHGHIVG